MPLPAPGASKVASNLRGASFLRSSDMLMLLAPASAFSYHLIGARSSGAVATAARPVAMSPAQPVRWQTAARLAVPRMVQVDESSSDIYDDFMGLNEAGESVPLELEEKEKLYLECLDAFYNEGGKQLLGDEEYNQLKLDLDFEGAKIVTFSKDEIKFVLANKRFKMGKPILDDAEYDALRNRLKAAGSTVIIHDGAKCNVEDGICKADLTVDAGKTRLLYLPGSLGGLLLVQEAFFWSVGLDPIISTVLGLVPAYFFGVWFTENVFAQKPLVTQAACPNCGYLNTIFFGDLFSVATDGIVPGALTIDSVGCKCPNCKKEVRPRPPPCRASRPARRIRLRPPPHCFVRLTPCCSLPLCAQLVADRESMIIQTKEPVAS